MPTPHSANLVDNNKLCFLNAGGTGSNSGYNLGSWDAAHAKGGVTGTTLPPYTPVPGCVMRPSTTDDVHKKGMLVCCSSCGVGPGRP